MKRKWFYYSIILVLLGVVLISTRALFAGGLHLNRIALADGGMNDQGGFHNLWGTTGQASARTPSAGSSSAHSGLWGSEPESADLNSLVFSTGALTPAFAPGTTTYTQTVDNSASSLNITAEVVDATSTVTANGTPVPSGYTSGSINLAYGTNTIAIVVTARDGVLTKTYTVTVTRYSKVFLPIILR